MVFVRENTGFKFGYSLPHLLIPFKDENKSYQIRKHKGNARQRQPLAIFISLYKQLVPVQPMQNTGILYIFIIKINRAIKARSYGLFILLVMKVLCLQALP